MRYATSYINITKLASDIRRNRFTVGKRRSIGVGNNGLKISYAINMGTGKAVEFSYFDFVVCDALYSLYCGRTKGIADVQVTVSLGDILHTMSGSSSQTITSAKKAKLRESIEKLADTEIVIELEDEAAARQLTNCSGWITGRIAPLAQTAESSDKYTFCEKMPLYEYAEAIHQMINYPTAMLETGGTNTNEVIMIKHYLIKRLEMLRNGKNRFDSNVISYSYRKRDASGEMAGVMSELGIIRTGSSFAAAGAWNKKVKSVHNTVIGILDSYTKAGYIFGYDEVYDKGTPSGVKLKLNADKNIYVNDPKGLDFGVKTAK
ncbi:MAG: hypothetical protein ACI4JF_03395 [Oscillospiraceae bacterium]